MIVWGGHAANYPYAVNTGSKYDPSSDTWTPTSITNAPEARAYHTAVWTGSLMIVWGGSGTIGGRYDPVSDSWTPTSPGTAPSARANHTAVWTGNLMIVWGGNENPVEPTKVPVNTGGRYDPAIDTWTPTSTIDAPSPRQNHSSVWTGRSMLVWGGDGGYLPLESGGRYDPASDTWTPMSIVNAPSSRLSQSAVWTGSRLIVWGGFSVTISVPVYLNTGASYNPDADNWTPTSLINAPAGRQGHGAIWTGTEMIVWGGTIQNDYGYFNDLNDGGRYDPANDTWTPVSTTNAPFPRSYPSAIWSGDQMLVWGGISGPVYLRDATNIGGRYDPQTDTWLTMSTVGAPLARYAHTAVWTGDLMIVWGGYGRDVGQVNTGGRYDPATDTWTSTSTVNAPQARQGHTAVWVDDFMIVWGGYGRITDFPLQSGGRYGSSKLVPYYQDADGDGYGDPNVSVHVCTPPPGYVLNTLDCDDANPAVHPGAIEVCNGVDDDCDEVIDDQPAADASCDDGDVCTTDVCHSGVCTHGVAIIPGAVCTADPDILNLQSYGLPFGVSLTLTNLCSGQPLDPTPLTPIYVAGVFSPSYGWILLPTPNSGSQCNARQDGIWETLSTRVFKGNGAMEIHFVTPSDGLCSTLDGNRQDILALLRTFRLPDQAQSGILFAGSYPGSERQMQCGAPLTVLNKKAIQRRKRPRGAPVSDK